MNYLTAAHTDIGIRKSTNQDSALVMEAETDVGRVLLTVICDGMGGLAKGEVASSAVIREFSQWFEQQLPCILAIENPTDRIFSSWEKIALACNEKIFAYGKRHGVSMGTTLVAMLFIGEKYYIINIGDSRAYCLSDRLYLLTKDQTFVAREIAAGRMTPEEAKIDPRRSVLLQCVGASAKVTPDFLKGKIQRNAVYFVCSDGFRHQISEEEIMEKLGPDNAANMEELKYGCVYLTELVKNRKETDNITVAAIKTK